MKKILLLACVLFSFTLNLSAQSEYNDTDIDKYISNRTIPKVTDATYVGSPYLNDSFSRGTISKNEVVIAQNIGLRYNANKDYFEIKKTLALEDSQAKLMQKSDEITVQVNNKKYVYIPRSEHNSMDGYFTLLLKDDNVTLYLKNNMKFISGQKAINSMAADVPPTYKENSSYFITKSNKTLIELPNSKKGKLKAFDDHKKEVKTYMKENKLNINKEVDFIKLIKYYNTL